MSVDTRRRVKVYALNADRQWDDKGTGHVALTAFHDGMSLVVKSEDDGSIILDSKIHMDTQYQKQQHTLIVWTESDNFDLALSFQEKECCDEIYHKICSFQGKDPSFEGVDDEEEDIVLETIPCQLEELDQIHEQIQSCLPTARRRELLAEEYVSSGYIPKLLEIFTTCEEKQDLPSLHKLYEIFKNMFILNKSQLLEVLLADANLRDVIGVLEYDPSLTSIDDRKRHREFLEKESKFKQVIEFGNPELVDKIHQTYRMQYLQDVVLPAPTIYEENLYTTLSNMLFFSKVEIVSNILDNENFLRELIFKIINQDTVLNDRRDLVSFLKEFCTFSQILPPEKRESFFKILASIRVLSAVEVSLTSDDLAIRAAATDIFTFFVDYNPNMIREYALDQQVLTPDDADHSILNIVIDKITTDPDPDLGTATQLSNVMRLILDPDNGMLSTDKEKEQFLLYFYRNCMHVLLRPVYEAAVDERPYDHRRTAQLLSIILEMLTYFFEHHGYHLRDYIVHKSLLRRILVFLKSRHTFLVLSTIRFLRRLVATKDEFYYRFLIHSNIFSPIVQILTANKRRYNLLDSAILEMFEFILNEEITILLEHLESKFGDVLDELDYVETFKNLREKCAKLKEKCNDIQSERELKRLKTDEYI
ncbi:Serine/threonine-protein phosphatase 4 regulatory subunit 3, partial [Fragariocoptes setiger]